MKEYADATALLDRIVAEQERRTSRYDPSLVVPLTLLGDALNGEANTRRHCAPTNRRDTSRESQCGLHTTEQIEHLYREADALASMGKIDKATDRQEYAYETLLRHYGPFSPSWCRDSTISPHGTTGPRTSSLREDSTNARSTSSHAADGETDPNLIPALRGLAQSYKEERFPPFTMPDERQPPARRCRRYAGLPHPGRQVAVVNRFGPGEIALVQIVKILSADPNVDAARRRPGRNRSCRLVPVVRQTGPRDAGLCPRAADSCASAPDDRRTDRGYFGQPDSAVSAHSRQSADAAAERCARTRRRGTSSCYTVTAHGDSRRPEDHRFDAGRNDGLEGAPRDARRALPAAFEGDTPVARQTRCIGTPSPTIRARTAGTAAGKTSGSESRRRPMPRRQATTRPRPRTLRRPRRRHLRQPDRRADSYESAFAHVRQPIGDSNVGSPSGRELNFGSMLKCTMLCRQKGSVGPPLKRGRENPVKRNTIVG